MRLGMRVAVYGAGAIGGLLASRLETGGARVSVVARGAHLAAIQRRGLRVRSAAGEVVTYPAALEDPVGLGVQDAVIVAVKAPALPSVAAGIGPLLGPGTPVVFAMNGIPWWYFRDADGDRRLDRLDPGGALEAAVGPRAVGGVVYSYAEVESPGVVALGPAPSRLVIGETDGRDSPRCETLAAALEAGGFPAQVTPRIRDAVWSKLLGNVGSGPFAVLTSSATGDILGAPALEAASRQMMREVASVARALGCDPGEPEASLPGLLRSAHRPSVLQDLDRGRPMEVESLYATPLALARAAGVATPMLDLLVALVQQRARAAGLYAG